MNSMEQNPKQDVTLAGLYALILEQAEWERGFFEKDLLPLARAVQALAPPAAGSEILRGLYYGSYEPEVYKDSPIDQQFGPALTQAHDALMELLTRQEKEKFEAYMDVLSERNSEVAELAYESGFRAAVQMLIAGLTSPGNKQKETKEEQHEKRNHSPYQLV